MSEVVMDQAMFDAALETLTTELANATAERAQLGIKAGIERLKELYPELAAE
jgi:hypothetical protein